MANDLVVYETRGLRFSRLPETLDEMGSVMEGLQYFGDNLPWTIGDAINYGQDKFGEAFNQYIPERSAKTYMNYCWVSRRVPFDERKWDLTWSHYAEAAALVREARNTILQQAQEEDWTVAQLRRVIKRAPETKGKMVNCPSCGAELEYKAGSLAITPKNEQNGGQAASEPQSEEGRS